MEWADRISASLSLPPAADRTRPGAACPAARGPGHRCPPRCAPSSPGGCPQTTRYPPRAPRTRQQGRCPPAAARPAPGQGPWRQARPSPGGSLRPALREFSHPRSSWHQSRTPFPPQPRSPAAFPAGPRRQRPRRPAAFCGLPAPAQWQQQGWSPLLRTAGRQTAAAGLSGLFPAGRASRPAMPEAFPRPGCGTAPPYLRRQRPALPAGPPPPAYRTAAARRPSVFFLRVSNASPPRPGAAFSLP